MKSNQEEIARWELHQEIPSDTRVACELIRSVVSTVEELGWDQAATFAVHMAMEEAVMNSIKHGNRRDPSKFVKIDVQIFAEHFVATICDEGEGFDPDNVPDPRCDENLERCSGRGVLLIRQFMDEVVYDQQGRRVTMRKRKDAQGALR
jgi:serine/threonine-protein kinase RsbW